MPQTDEIAAEIGVFKMLSPHYEKYLTQQRIKYEHKKYNHLINVVKREIQDLDGKKCYVIFLCKINTTVRKLSFQSRRDFCGFSACSAQLCGKY